MKRKQRIAELALIENYCPWLLLLLFSSDNLVCCERLPTWHSIKRRISFSAAIFDVDQYENNLTSKFARSANTSVPQPPFAHNLTLGTFRMRRHVNMAFTTQRRKKSFCLVFHERRKVPEHEYLKFSWCLPNLLLDITNSGKVTLFIGFCLVIPTEANQEIRRPGYTFSLG